MATQGNKDSGESHRKRDRLELHIPVRVICKETDGTGWTEITHIEDVTQFGASFTLEHRLDVGRIVHLSLPLPWRLRQYDQAEEQYRIYALVRWAKPTADKNRVLFGVAFIGKSPPASYLHDPSRIYGTQGFTDKRREGRIQAAIPVQVEVINEHGDVVGREDTVTENISRRGASVYTMLEPAPGSFVHVISQGGFETTGIVRRRRKGEDNIPRIHLEFLGKEWPLDMDDAESEEA
jgi:hypothetical protein